MYSNLKYSVLYAIISEQYIVSRKNVRDLQITVEGRDRWKVSFSVDKFEKSRQCYIVFPPPEELKVIKTLRKRKAYLRDKSQLMGLYQYCIHCENMGYTLPTLD